MCTMKKENYSSFPTVATHIHSINWLFRSNSSDYFPFLLPFYAHIITKICVIN